MTNRNHYKPGDNYVICDVTGLKIHASKARRRWDGAVVMSSQLEQRHTQEFVKGIKENPKTIFSRPRQENNFLDTNEVTPESL